MFIINFIRWLIFGNIEFDEQAVEEVEKKKRGRPAKAQWLYDTLECLELKGGGYIIDTDKWPIKGTPSSAPINAYFASRGDRKYSVKKAGDKTYSITLIQK